MALPWSCLPIISLHQSCWETEEVKKRWRDVLQHPLNTHLCQTYRTLTSLTQLGGGDNELTVGVLSVMPELDTVRGYGGGR